jgi:demethylmenaquinone methyltransferase/2-methoxy-6-polyprenyl-1,4-benzoquinol methylase
MNASQDKKRARATYDFLSHFYDFMSGSAEGLARQQAVELLDLKPGEIILEIGCGTGTACIDIAKKLQHEGEVIGIDLSVKMLRAAQKKFKRAGLHRQAVFVCGDAAHLPITSLAAGVILICFTLELFPEAEIGLVLAEMKRVLTENGRLGVLSMSKNQPQAPLLKPYEWLYERFPAWIDCRPILLKQTLVGHGFKVCDARQGSLFGLPYEIVLAKKKS